MNLFLLVSVGVSRDILYITYYICDVLVFLGDISIVSSKCDGRNPMRMEKFSNGYAW